jgi:hypothetical protein
MGCAWPNERKKKDTVETCHFSGVNFYYRILTFMRRKSIKLQPHDDNLLRQLHRASKVPVDQWAQRPRFLSRFTNEWNNLSGRHDSGDDIRHYIITQRKRNKWFRFGDDYDRLKSPGDETFTSKEWDALRIAYVEMNVGRDRFAADGNLRDELAEKFHERTGRYVSGERLYAAVMAQQKHKENGWPLVEPDRKKGRGFKDIDDVG